MNWKWTCEKCGAIFREKEILWERIYGGNEIEPPEDLMRCPNCGAEEIERYYEDEDGI